MRKLLLASLILAMVAGCARVRESNFNPLNWFGGSVSTPVATEANPNPLIPRRRASIFRSETVDSYRGTLVAEVEEMRVERIPGGAVVKATGVMASLGGFDVRLVRDEAASSGDTLTLDMRALQPATTRGVGAEPSRRVTAALNITDQDLLGIRTIRVVSAGNVRTVRR